MRFENAFDVDAPVDEVYETLLDLEKVAPAMPGAQVTEKISDDAYKVAIKVKLGPMTMNYRGDVEVREKDPEAHRATLHVKAREARGQGTATADVTQRLEAADGGGTHATIEADVQLAGRAAAMGRGLIQDVSAKLVQQFADNLSQMLGGGGGGAAAGAEPEPAGEAAASVERETPGSAPSGGGSADGGASSTGASTPRSAPSGSGSASSRSGSAVDDDDDAIDAFGLAGGVARDKLRDPRALGAVAVVVLLLAWLLGRRGR